MKAESQNQVAMVNTGLLVLALLACTILLWAALPATDAFTDADYVRLNAHGTSWTEQPSPAGALYILSNSIYGGTEQEGFNYWNADAFSNDQYSQLTVILVSNSPLHSVGPSVRVSSSAFTGYALVVYDADGGTTHHLVLKKALAGVVTDIHDESYTTYANDVVKLTAVGTILSAYVNAIKIFDHVDADIAAGSAGVYHKNTSSSACKGDDWEGGDVASASVARRRILQ